MKAGIQVLLITVIVLEQQKGGHHLYGLIGSHH